MIFIGLGSNIGNPALNLRKALEFLSRYGVRVIRCSAFYRTEPWGITEQDVFVNAVAEVDFEGQAIDLLDILLQIELDMGRERRFKWGPRLIDLDILEFHQMEVDTDRLRLPHPYYPERDFVLVPFAELEPEWVPTGMDVSIKERIIRMGIPPLPIWEE